jgi:two-component system chemotaxis sensor kinase CheA
MSGGEGRDERLAQLRETYREEAEELAGVLERSLLSLEADPGDAESIHAAFRAIHTIKGSGSMVGASMVARFGHEMEGLLARARDGQVAIGPDLIGLCLRGLDRLKALLIDEPAEFSAEDLALMEGFRSFSIASEAGARGPASATAPGGEKPETVEPMPMPAAESPETASTQISGEAGLRTYRIRFRPQPDIFLIGGNPLAAIRQLSALGRMECTMNREDVPALEDLDPERCYLSWDIVLTTDRGLAAIRDAFIFYESGSDVHISEIDDPGAAPEGAEYKRIGEILVEKGVLSEEAVRESLPPRLGEVLVEKGLVSRYEIESALHEQQFVRTERSSRQRQEAASSIRVKFEKLDQLVNLAGEMATVQARITDLAAKSRERDLESLAEHLERLTASLRDIAMGIRMVPLSALFESFFRTVRDLGTELGKQAELRISGGDTELDKYMVDHLKDPIMHIIRNSMDHGIEAPTIRTAAGKPAAGAIELSAAYEGSSVVITVRDDGAGLDLERIRRKAVERGLLRAEDDPSDKELEDLVFLPGFSTAEKATSVSGRGVGMDVVRSDISAVGGEVELTSWPGRGTAISLRIPLTLAIIDGLLVRAAGESFFIDVDSVLECRDDVGGQAGAELSTAAFRGELIPVIDLRWAFAARGASLETACQMVVVGTARRKAGLLVERIVGQAQTVIKPFVNQYSKENFISGAAILGSGEVALILDAARLLKRYGAEGERGA